MFTRSSSSPASFRSPEGAETPLSRRRTQSAPGEVRVEAELLRQVAEQRPHALGAGGHVLAVEHDAPRRRLEQARDDAHQRGLARPVRPQQAEHPVRDLEVDALQRSDRTGIHLDQSLMDSIGPRGKAGVPGACVSNGRHGGGSRHPAIVTRDMNWPGLWSSLRMALGWRRMLAPGRADQRGKTRTMPPRGGHRPERL
jgi:hypothetical protein